MMKNNWYALLISILSNQSPDESLRKMGVKVQHKERQLVNLTDAQIEQIIFLKKTSTWDEIAVDLNIRPASLCALVKRYERKKAIANEPTKVPLTISFNKTTITL